MDLSKLNEIDLSNIDVNDIKKIGSAPAPVRIAIIVLVCLIAGGAGIFLDTTKQLDKLEATEAKEKSLRATFDEKQSKAANLESYAQQLDEMKQSFGALLRQLPNKTERVIAHRHFSNRHSKWT